MEVDDGSTEDAVRGNDNGDDTEVYRGVILDIKIKDRHGFIKPSDNLPPDYNQNKDVYFHFDKVRGPKVDKDMMVVFKLNPVKKSMPEVTVVCREGFDISSRNTREGRKRGRRRDRSANRNRSSSRKNNERTRFGNPQNIDITSDKDKETTAGAKSQNTASSNMDKSRSAKTKGGKARVGILPYTGKVCTVKDNFGFVKCDGPLPDDYEQKDVIFFMNKLRVANFQLVNGDVLEFNLGTKEKDRPVAINAKLVRCVARQDHVINSYLDSTLRQLENIDQKIGTVESDNSDSNAHSKYGLILELVSCSAVAQCIGGTLHMSDSTVCLVIEMVCLLKTQTSGIAEQFRSFLLALSGTKFLHGVDSRLGQFVDKCSGNPSSPHMKLVREFLRILAQVLPQKAGLVARLIKPVISVDKDTTEAFLYDILRQTAKLTFEEVSDMDWNELPLVPSTSELLLDGPLESAINLSPVKVTGAYGSTHEYVDTYFRLLRADCFDAIRTGIHGLMQGRLDPRDMNVYHKVSLVGILPSNTEAGIQLALKVTPCKPVQDWSTSSNLMFGNLLCLTGTGTFKDAMWAIVANREEKLLKTKQVIIVELCSEGNNKNDADCITSLAKSSGSILMVESPTYYRAYQPVFRALQTMDIDVMPFKAELVSVEDPLKYPDYIKRSSTIDGHIIHKSLRPESDFFSFLEHKSPSEGDTTLDDSQLKAIKLALSQRVGVIQGPPGTGKTYIGVQMVKLMMSISTRPNSPILVLTYKNHALDEFLKEMIKLYPQGVVRIGGRSNEPELEKYNLSEVRKQKKSLHLFKEIQALQEQQRQMQPQIVRALTNLSNSRLFSGQCLLNGFDDVKLGKLLTSCDWSKLNWSKSYVCSIVNKYEGNLKSLLEGEFDETKEDDAKDARDMFQKAVQMWTPSTKLFHQIEMVASRLFQPSQVVTNLAENVVNSVQNPKLKKKGTKLDNDEGGDERDLEDVQKERMSAILGSRGTSKTPDIVWIEHKKSDNKPHLLASSCVLLDDTPSAFWELFDNPWDLNEYDRAKLIQFLLLNQVKECEAHVKSLLEEYQSLCRSREELEDRHKVECIFNKKIIGMTITGASICQRLLSQIKPAVVIVEEAAEVLEPQLIAVLGEWVQHLILIGDHNQLPPPVECYTLARKYHFDISMMERLINNGYEYASLSKQNRMRPEFAELLLDIYPNLESNLTRVGKNQAPQCIVKSMFFWNHDHVETKERSVRNEDEADMVLQLALYLIEQQYKPENITILGAYLGQVRLLRKKVRDAESKYPELFSEHSSVQPQQKQKTNGKDNNSGAENKKPSINVHTIDLYQGDENDVVIVSLVRSNDRNQCGFLKKLNRRCVSQSRAKCGLYFVGNVKTLLGTDHWAKMIQTMHVKGCVGNAIELCCPKHKTSTVVKARLSSDIPIGGIFCKKNCAEVMACKKHFCPRKCQPPHSHLTCREEVNFFYQLCGHPGKRECYQDESTLRCQKLLQFSHKQCGHLGQRRCHEDESQIKCRQPCARRLTCKSKHLCGGVCGDPCDSANCTECAKIAKAEALTRQKAEEKLREQAKEEIKKKIEEIRKAPDPDLFKREDLSDKGDTASVYLDVQDLVLKYVQPGHNWYPVVTRIEKVTNLALESKWLESKSKRSDFRTALKFHGTSADAVDSIVKGGFRLGAPGMYGVGVYFATDSSKSAQRMYTKGSNQLLLCDVLLGKSMTVDKAIPDMTLQKLKTKGYDSLFARRDTKSTGGVLYDEFVVYDPHQALPRYIIHYSCNSFGASQPIPSGTAGRLVKAATFQHHHIKPKRAVDPNDPLEHEFRMAESQFSRMGQRQYKVLSVDFYVNPPLSDKFNKRQAQLEAKYGLGSPESKYILGFHGTDPNNFDAIVKTNFDMSKVKTCAFGLGIYFSEFPDVSIGYAGGAKKLLLCKILPGKSFDIIGNWNMKPLNPAYDSHRVNKNSQGSGWAIVIDNPDQILPCYVITYG